MENTIKKEIHIEPLETEIIDIDIIGITPLLMNRFSERQQELLKKYWEGLKGTRKKDIPTEKQIVEEATYYNDDGKVCFPTSGFRRGIEEVAKDKMIDIGFTGKAAKGSIRFLEPLTEINFKEMVINKSWGKVKKTPKLAIRPEFRDWSCKLKIAYNPRVVSTTSLLNLLNWAGSYCGLGDWRPSTSGTYGQYKVKTT